MLFVANAQVAQSVEQRTENPCVGGSIPPLGKYIGIFAGAKIALVYWHFYIGILASLSGNRSLDYIAFWQLHLFLL